MTPRPPFRPAPRVEVPAAPMMHSLNLRDGEREIEVSGSAAFVRQVLDDLPAMWARLHGEGSTRPARIDLPRSRRSRAGAVAEHVESRAPRAPRRARHGRLHRQWHPRWPPTASTPPRGARPTTRCWRSSRNRRDPSRWLPSESASAAASPRSRCAASSSATLRRYRSPTSGRPRTVCAGLAGTAPSALAAALWPRRVRGELPGSWCAHNERAGI